MDKNNNEIEEQLSLDGMEEEPVKKDDTKSYNLPDFIVSKSPEAEEPETNSNPEPEEEEPVEHDDADAYDNSAEEEYEYEDDIPTRGTRKRRRLRILPLMLILALLAALIAGGWMLLNGRNHQSESGDDVPSPAQTQEPANKPEDKRTALPDVTANSSDTDTVDVTASPETTAETESDPKPSASSAPSSSSEKKKLVDMIEVKEEKVSVSQNSTYDYEDNLEIDDDAKDRYEVKTDADLSKIGDYEVKVLDKDTEETICSYKLSVTDPSYSVGAGPQGSAGRIYMNDGKSVAVNYENDVKTTGAKMYRTASLVDVIYGDFANNYDPGATLTLADENGYTYEYKCASRYGTYTDGGVTYLTDGTAIDDAAYGHLALVSNDSVTFWNIQ